MNDDSRMDMRDLELELKKDRGIDRVLAGLPVRTPPPHLATVLRVMASRERQRVLASMFPGAWPNWYERASLAAKNVMRPLAVPLAGGLFSAVALFSMWVAPTYPLGAASTTTGSFDPPTTLTTLPTVKGTAPMNVSGADVVVEVTVDDQGRMVDYSVVNEGGVLRDPAIRRELENFLLFTEFAPATSSTLGRWTRPRPGKMRIPISTSSIVVKG